MLKKKVLIPNTNNIHGAVMNFLFPEYFKTNVRRKGVI
ncbi:hypothetical protein A33Q_4516 [Indibacter alkaliphilus LW1]|uniref:Uncharacterized protein n=1 Tax=Indibacter alkaliphilus (strain CCUG 57479 / KCTC 22604 / LW1) TaxID=1189612 RepID=S2DR99_INDAL|nr:hypothetical protein A33Q_4516 [Indibacter alkaliphilus LW1]